MGFPRQNTEVGCHFLSRDFPKPGVETESPALTDRFFFSLLSHQDTQLVYIIKNRGKEEIQVLIFIKAKATTRQAVFLYLELDTEKGLNI